MGEVGRKLGSPANLDTGPELTPTASVQLPNRKHELFARFISQGETYSHAYELAGYSPSTANASTMANKPEIAARIGVLKKEKEERDLRYEIEMRKANLDPTDPQASSREVAEWSVKQILDLFWENARLAQMSGQFTTANDSLKIIAEIMGLLNKSTGTSNDRTPATQIGIAVYKDAVMQLGEGGGVSPIGEDNPLAPRISGATGSRRNK